MLNVHVPRIDGIIRGGAMWSTAGKCGEPQECDSREARRNQTSRILDRKDLSIGTVVALVMGTVFTVVGGRPLVVTFVPALVVSWLVFAWLFRSRKPIPQAAQILPIYFVTIAWQFIHFAEEFLTQFNDSFPHLYGAPSFSPGLFVTFNMVSYAVFVTAFLLAFTKNLKFLLVPVLFFIIYGAIGNAISHTWWVVLQKSYFPGFYTALGYWLLGPWALAALIGSKRNALIIIAGLAMLLIPTVTLFRQTT